ncbi:MAG: 50S ribosome-binding GTPase [Phycisphaeraceae bacterium]|nr:50S ribosome-binding GTPase [Phycisphaeraceae bacterium]
MTGPLGAPAPAPAAAFEVLTSAEPGAIAIIRLTGPASTLVRVVRPFPALPGAVAYADLAGVDAGLAARLDADTLLVTPHGGAAVVAAITDRLRRAGLRETTGAPRERFPEARDAREASLLEALSRAASPLAVPVLTGAISGRADTAIPGVDRLDRLVDPPLVAIAGPPGCGKSSLLNALCGRASAVTDPGAGTTRDWTVTRLDLGGLVVRWADTPGWRPTEDPLEMAAIRAAQPVLESADLLIVAGSPDHPACPTDGPADGPAGGPAVLSRRPDLRIGLKSDLGALAGADLCVSARTGDGIAALLACIRHRLLRGPSGASTDDSEKMLAEDTGAG